MTVMQTSGIPTVGTLKTVSDRGTGQRAWIVLTALFRFTPEDARKYAAELLNAADDAERKNTEGL